MSDAVTAGEQKVMTPTTSAQAARKNDHSNNESQQRQCKQQ